MNELTKAKAATRREMRQRLGALNTEEHAIRSSRLIHRLQHHPEVQNAEILGAFFPLPDEPNVLKLFDGVTSQGKVLALPRVVARDRALEFWRIRDWDIDTREGYRSIREPIPERCQRLQPEDLHCLLVPGLAFDRRGYRLGRGRGFYDRFLQNLPTSTRRLGLFWSFQEVPEVPVGKHDQKLDLIFTDETIHQPPPASDPARLT